MTHLVRAPGINDLLDHDGAVLVLTGNELLRIGPVAAELISACTEPRTLGELVRHCHQTFGPAPDGTTEAHVARAVDALIEKNLLRRVTHG